MSERKGHSQILRLIRRVTLALGLCGWALTAELQAGKLEYDPDMTLVIRDNSFHAMKGSASRKHVRDGSRPGLSLSPGDDVVLELKNEDKMPHEFVSPLFALVEFQLWGKATVIYTHTAMGVRVEQGETVALGFEVPKGFSGKQFKFWCNLHGKLHDDALQGEIFILKAEQGHLDSGSR